jgi:hypothetical protein
MLRMRTLFPFVIMGVLGGMTLTPVAAAALQKTEIDIHPSKT